MPKGNEIMLYLLADNKDLKAKLGDAEKALNNLQKKTEAAGAGMADVFRKIKEYAATYIAYNTIRSLVELAGEVDTVQKAFNGLSAGAKLSGEALVEAVNKSAKGTISNLDIMKSSNLALQLMGTEIAEYLPKMTEIAVSAARAQGIKVSQMLNDIVVASGRRSVMILDNLGISSARAGVFMQQYARDHNLVADKMTDTQKSAAFFFAVMKAGGELVQRSGTEALTLGERLQVIAAQSANAKEQISKGLIPGLQNLTGTLTEATNGSNGLMYSLGKVGSAFMIGLSNLVLSFQWIKAEIKLLAEYMKAPFAGLQISITEFLASTARKMALFFQSIPGIGKEAYDRLTQYANEATAEVSMAKLYDKNRQAALGQLQADADLIRNKIKSNMQEVANLFNGVYDAQVKAAGGTAAFQKKVQEMAAGLKKLNLGELWSFMGKGLDAELYKATEQWLEMQQKFGTVYKQVGDKMVVDEEATQQRLMEIRQAYAQNIQLIQQKFAADFYDYTGNAEQAEILREKTKHDELIRIYQDSADKRAAIEQAYQKKLAEVHAKHDVFMKNFTEGTKQAFSSAMSSFEMSTKKALKETIEGKNGWKEWTKSIKDLLIQFVIDLLWATAKALILKAVMSTINGGGGGGMEGEGGGGWQGAMGAGMSGAMAGGSAGGGWGAVGGAAINMGMYYMQNYEKGKIPVLQSGYVPKDHYMAYIGTREAVLDAETTRANYPLVMSMMANKGQSVETGGNNTQVYNISGNVMTDEFVERTLVKKLENYARLQGGKFIYKPGYR